MQRQIQMPNTRFGTQVILMTGDTNVDRGGKGGPVRTDIRHNPSFYGVCDHCCEKQILVKEYNEHTCLCRACLSDDGHGGDN
jgi:hypothetical protein